MELLNDVSRWLEPGERKKGLTGKAEPQGTPSIPVSLLAEVQRSLVLLLAPFAPYLAHELWEMLGEKGNLLRMPWPKYDPALAKEEEIEIPVQMRPVRIQLIPIMIATESMWLPIYLPTEVGRPL